MKTCVNVRNAYLRVAGRLICKYNCGDLIQCFYHKVNDAALFRLFASRARCVTPAHYRSLKTRRRVRPSLRRVLIAVTWNLPHVNHLNFPLELDPRFSQPSIRDIYTPVIAIQLKYSRLTLETSFKRWLLIQVLRKMKKPNGEYGKIEWREFYPRERDVYILRDYSKKYLQKY